MPDEEIVEQAESSPATVQPPATEAAVPTPTLPERQKTWTSEERRNWRMTGEEPQKKTAEPVEGVNKVESAPTVTEPKKELTPEERSQRDRERNERRFQRQYGEERARRQAAERRIAELEKAKPAEAAPAPPHETTFAADPNDPEPLETDPAFDGDFIKWQKVHNRWSARQEVKALREEDSRRQAQQQAEDAFLEQQADWHKRCADYRKTNKDFDKAFTTVAQRLKEAEMPDVDAALIDSDVGPALIAHLHAHPDEFDQLLDMSPIAAIRHIGKLELQLARAPKPKTVTTAPDSPAHVGGRNESVSGPPLGSKAWKDTENAKEAARLTQR